MSKIQVIASTAGEALKVIRFLGLKATTPTHVKGTIVVAVPLVSMSLAKLKAAADIAERQGNSSTSVNLKSKSVAISMNYSTASKVWITLLEEEQVALVSFGSDGDETTAPFLVDTLTTKE